MKYANTYIVHGTERIATVLPLELVPGFDPANPPQVNTYGVADDVEVGWVKQPDGSFATPEPAPPPVPQVVSRFQGFAALMQAGYLDDVEAYMLTADPFEQLAWETITEMRRNSPMTVSIGTLLGLSHGQIDDLFRFAFTITA